MGGGGGGSYYDDTSKEATPAVLEYSARLIT